MTGLACVFVLAACGGDGPAGPGAPWVGNWRLTLENGVAPSGYSSTMNLQSSSFTSTFTGGGQNCSWSGTVSATSTQISFSFTSATGSPCTTAVGATRTASWSLTNGNNTLTLDFTSTGGTRQVWSRS